MITSKQLIPGFLIIAALSSCSSATDNKKEDAAIKVETYTPTQLTNDDIYLSGMVTAQKTAVISTRVMGFVKKVYVKQGEKVKQGQLLIAINSDDLNAKKAQTEAMITEAEAAAKNAKRDYERYQKLHEQNSVSDKELENMALNNTSMQSKVKMAHQSLNAVNAMLAYTNITAPFAGTVTQKMIDEGSTASPGIPLLSMEQSGEMEITSSVPENFIKYIHTGDSVNVDIKSLNTIIKGTVSELSPSAYLTGGQYSMKIAIDDKGKATLRSGMYVGIHIPEKIEQATTSTILINQSSVFNREQLTGVYVVDNENQAMLRWVRLGKKSGNQVEVLSGLNSNDKVIVNPSNELYNGKKVIVSK